jgi:hemerythrin-like domain-containing protein
MRETLRILRNEHFALSALLQTLLLMLAESRSRGVAPDFAALRAILFYIDEFPERRHHRKESELLFPKLRARTPLSRALLDHLDEDHARGEAKVRALAHALTAFELLGAARRAAFESAAERYVDFYRTHMMLEEREVFPLAERVLEPADWDELDEAMAREGDPLAGAAPEAAYDALFARIVRLVPAPLGLGEPVPPR